MKFTIALICTIVSIIVLIMTAITGKEISAAIAAIASFTGAYTSARFADGKE